MPTILKKDQKERATFVTISGKMSNKDATEALKLVIENKTFLLKKMERSSWRVLI